MDSDCPWKSHGVRHYLSLDLIPCQEPVFQPWQQHMHLWTFLGPTFPAGSTFEIPFLNLLWITLSLNSFKGSCGPFWGTYLLSFSNGQWKHPLLCEVEHQTLLIEYFNRMPSPNVGTWERHFLMSIMLFKNRRAIYCNLHPHLFWLPRRLDLGLVLFFF